MGILKFLFFILILLFPLGEIIRFQFENNIAFRINDIGVGFLVGFWLIWHLWQRRKIEGVLTKPILAFLLIGLISLLLNLKALTLFQFFISFLYLLRFFLYAGIYFVILDFESSFKQKIPFLLLFSSTIIVLGGFAQYFFYPSLRNLYYLGWDEHLYRMFSSFLDPNFLGSFLVLNFLLIGGMFFNYLKDKKRERIGLLGILGMLTLVAVFLTYSRSAFLMLIVSISVLLTLIGRKKWIVLLAGISILVFVISSRNFDVENLNLLRTASSEARLESAKDALEVIKRNPVFGVGFNAYRYAQLRYGFQKEEKVIASHADAGTDNSFLFVLATGGLVGFLAYIYLWIKIFQSNIRAGIKGERFISIVVIASSLGLFVNALFINSLFYPFIMEWMWILIGIRENR